MRSYAFPLTTVLYAFIGASSSSAEGSRSVPRNLRSSGSNNNRRNLKHTTSDDCTILIVEILSEDPDADPLRMFGM